MANGGCQCGDVRYRIDPAATLTFYACHCRNCQRQSGSAFALSLILLKSAFELLQGQLSVWTRPQNGKQHAFCGTCGTRIHHCAADRPDRLSLKAGTLDTPVPVPPVGNIWTDSAPDWSPRVPGSLGYTGQPITFHALEAAYGAAQWQ